MSEKEILINILNRLNLSVSDRKADQLLLFYRLLINKNQTMNLTSITDFTEVAEKHFADSLMFVPEKSDASLIDMGSGAGFPGIPLKIMYPDLSVLLIDSLNKRCRFLQEVIDELHLSGIKIVCGRAEELGRDDSYREQYDYCVSRAVASLVVLSEYCLPFVRIGGEFVAYKAGDTDTELQEASPAIHLLGGEIKETPRFNVPGTDLSRSLIMIKKIKKTDPKYPRRTGMPKKHPLC